MHLERRKRATWLACLALPRQFARALASQGEKMRLGSDLDLVVVIRLGGHDLHLVVVIRTVLNDRDLDLVVVIRCGSRSPIKHAWGVQRQRG